MIVKTGRAGEITRLSDVGRVELGAQTYGQAFTLDGQPAAGLAIYQAPGANALNVAHQVQEKLAVLKREFPQGLISEIPFDTTKFVEQSIHEVYKTLYEAAFLVLVVILVFLQDWRAMLIPATTVPVTIIGAFAAMAALGFTINFSTLFAIVLAIGIVVNAPSWWWKGPSTTPRRACRGARRRALPCASCSVPPSASRWY